MDLRLIGFLSSCFTFENELLTTAALLLFSVILLPSSVSVAANIRQIMSMTLPSPFRLHYFSRCWSFVVIILLSPQWFAYTSQWQFCPSRLLSQLVLLWLLQWDKCHQYQNSSVFKSMLVFCCHYLAFSALSSFHTHHSGRFAHPVGWPSWVFFDYSNEINVISIRIHFVFCSSSGNINMLLHSYWN